MNSTHYQDLENQLQRACKKLGRKVPLTFKHNRILTEMGLYTDANEALPHMTPDLEIYVRDSVKWDEIRKELGWKKAPLPPVLNEAKYLLYQQQKDEEEAKKQKLTNVFARFDNCFVTPRRHSLKDAEVQSAVKESIRNEIESEKDYSSPELLLDRWRYQVVPKSNGKYRVEFYFDEDDWKPMQRKCKLHDDCEYHVFANTSDGNWTLGIPFDVGRDMFHLVLR